MQKVKRAFLWLAGIAIIGYAGLVLTLYVVQRDMLYVPPQKFRTAPAAAGFPQAEEIILNTQDGEKIIAAMSLDGRVAGDIAAPEAPASKAAKASDEPPVPPVHALAVLLDGGHLFQFVVMVRVIDGAALPIVQ